MAIRKKCFNSYETKVQMYALLYIYQSRQVSWIKNQVDFDSLL